jgi:thymidylate synthase (FAD)
MIVHSFPTLDDDLTVVNAARASFGKEKAVFDEADAKLIRYLAKHQHIMPFAHPHIRFRIKAPIFVARQLAKHQVGGVWSEESRRYVDDEPTVHTPDQWRGRADNVKQGSGGPLDDGNTYICNRTYNAAVGIATEAYYTLLEHGVAPEMARGVLPLASMTTWIWTGSLLFFSRVCKLRLDAHAQAETREIAEKIAYECAKVFPVSWEALMGSEAGC